MKKRLRKVAVLLTCLLLACSIGTPTVLAGKRTVVSQFQNAAEELNAAEWNFTDNNIKVEKGKLIIPASSSSKYTKVISKEVAKPASGLEEFQSVESTLRIKALPQGQQLVFALGLASVDAKSGDEGNIEIVFTNNNGIRVSVIAYTSEGTVSLLEQAKSGVSLNNTFNMKISANTQGVMSVKINNRSIFAKQLPIPIEGRFGVLQTGSCGVEFDKLSTTITIYDRPENMNIDEDFENGEFNANELMSWVTAGTMPGAGAKIVEYNGSKVFMVSNVSGGYIGTKHQYSNFELSFDVPLHLAENVYDEDGSLIRTPSNMILLAFGEEDEVPIPTGNSYAHGINYWLLTPANGQSMMIEKAGWINPPGVELEKTADGLGNACSFKLTVIDGKCELQIKPLSAKSYTTMSSFTLDSFRSGYVRIWFNPSGNFAIDNLKITNLDTDPALVDVAYESSVMKVEDYVLEEEKDVFREKTNEVLLENDTIDYSKYIILGCASFMLLLVVTGIAIRLVQKRGGKKNEIEN